MVLCFLQVLPHYLVPHTSRNSGGWPAGSCYRPGLKRILEDCRFLFLIDMGPYISWSARLRWEGESPLPAIRLRRHQWHL